MKNTELVALFNAINNMGALKGVKFAYGISRNMYFIKPQIEALQKSIEATEGFKKYDEERIKLAEKHAKKGEDGKAVMSGEGRAQQYVIEDKEAFNAEWEALKAEHSEALEDQKQREAEYIKLMDEETTVELFKIKLSDVPEDISTAQLNSIFALISE